MNKNIRHAVFLPLLFGGQFAIQAQDAIDITRYPHAIGHLHMGKNQLNFNYLKDSEIRNDTVRVISSWDKPMTFEFRDIPSYLNCRVEPHPLPPRQDGLLIVTYDAVARKDYGFSNYNLGMYTNDDKQPIKTIFLSAYIEEDFSGLTKEDIESAPRIKFEKEVYNFGIAKVGEHVKYSYVFRNEGKRDLIIRATKASCGCTASSPEKTVLKPGESSKIDVDFNTWGRSGAQNKTIFVISNDPRNSNVALRIEGTIE
jgi:hypothetical protein